MNGYEALDDGATGKQLFLASLIRSEQLREVMSAIIEGSFEFTYFFEYREIYLISDFIALCVPGAAGNVQLDILYEDDSSFTNDLSLVHLILFFAAVEEELSGGNEPGDDEQGQWEEEGEEDD